MNNRLITVLFCCCFSIALIGQGALVYRPAGFDEVQEVTGTYGDNLSYKLYLPADPDSGKWPLVVFINGVGGDVTTWDQYIDWPKACAARGLAAVAYEVKRESPYENTREILDYLMAGKAHPQVDGDQLVLWMCSSNGRVGSRILFDPAYPQIKGGSLYYPAVLPDLPLDRTDIKLEIVRAGMDSYSLNQLLDAWIPKLLTRDIDLQLINLPAARHVFDLFDAHLPQSETTIRNTVNFMHDLAYGESAVSDPVTTPTRLLTLLQNNELEEAERYYRTAMEQDSITRTNLFYNGLYRDSGLGALSMALQQEEKYDAALLPLQWALRIAPEHPNNHDNLAALYEAKGDVERALHHSELALKYLEGFEHPNQAFVEAIRTAAADRIEKLRNKE
ncbi:hypothetical protein [Flavilitoribacter nigricans]|uniref:Uncharacterized protein n=1 Tax=Flavilitoribacter nigricans (strain ATCC 23147 / DSM 23189 / NBRC 102662 / NCIMB 1420 / SS-2) TaxID=1122177 RepID=A0A2D0N3N6_FLAN2|nr:hypothetical protein [Flavilitoribacter nigricans]PHN02998.1 hypothetical protein CRP01_29790 [Flavilitoribacter nigricans DSM 23189 = NBRC 102662]